MPESPPRHKALFRLSLGWTICVLTLLALSITSHFRGSAQLARHACESFFKQIVLTRAWNAKHGGVYLFTSDTLAPNPYLDTRDRDLTLPDGRILTRINPAFMTRLIAEMSKDEMDIFFHITSLSPLRPENAPDDWEREALLSFSTPEDARFERIRQAGADAYRYMAPLVVTASCLSCHARQDHELGDILGGISVSLPAAPYTAVTRGAIIRAVLSYCILWLAGMLGIVIFSRKTEEFETALRNRILFQQSLLDCLPIPVFFKNAAGKFLGCNQAYEQFLGRARTEILGKTVYDIAPDDLARIYDAQDQRLLQSGKKQVSEVDVQTRNLGLRQIILSKAVFRNSNGDADGIVGGIVDVTEERQLKARLEEMASELNTIFQHASVPLAYLNGKRTFVRINARFTEVSGYEELEILGQNSRLFFTSDQDFADFETTSGPVLLRGGTYRAEYPMRAKDGRLVWCNLIGKAVDAANMDRGTIWSIEDITERKELEKIREDVNRIMLHDLRSPLNGLIPLPELMMDDPNLTDDQRQTLVMIRDSGRRLLAKINSATDLLRMELGTYVYVPEEVDLCAVIRRIKNDLAGQARAKNVRFLWLVDGSPAQPDAHHPIQGEEGLLSTALANLVRNAVEASCVDCTVTIRLTHEPETVVIQVHNQGAVPVQIRERFFDKFVTFGKSKGSGIGTYSARLMVEAMGGTISMQTSEEEGTTISIRLPSLQ
jgi:PAS domain S-box-containing protein